MIETFDAFGVEWATFASNFPRDRVYSGNAELWQVYGASVGDASEEERATLFPANAVRIIESREERG